MTDIKIIIAAERKVLMQRAACVFDVANEREAMNETHTVQIKEHELSFILVLLSLTAIMIMFTESMLIPALPTLQAEFNTTGHVDVVDTVSLLSRGSSFYA